MKNSIKTSLWKLSGLFFATACSFFFNTSYGQITYFDDRDHIYQSVASILDESIFGDQSLHGPGYTVSSTAAQNATSPRGEIMRLDNAGNMVWVHYYNTLDRNHRFTHTEKYPDPNSGITEYLIVGSIDHDKQNSLLVARVDDDGNVLTSREYLPVKYDQLIGIKGVYSKERKEFVVAGVEYEDHNNPGNRRVLVMGLDMDLNRTWSYYLDSKHEISDADFVSDIIETDAGYLVVGTCNSRFASTPPGVLMVMMDASGVIWDRSYTYANQTNDIGASAIFDKEAQSVWVLSNSLKTRSFKLANYDLGGNFLGGYQYQSPTQKDIYGFALLQSYPEYDKLVIAAYNYGMGAADDAIPVVLEVDKASGGIVWQYTYSTVSNNILNYVENPLLRLAYPAWFHNDILNYKYNGDGYVFVADDLTYTPTYGTKFWAVNTGGQLPGDSKCDYKDTDLKDEKDITEETKVELVQEAPKDAKPELKAIRHKYEAKKCGSVEKMGTTSVATTEKDESIKIYPNPAGSFFTIEGYGEQSQLAIYDINGRIVISQKLTGNSQNIQMSALPSGTYMLEVRDGNESLHRQVLQKVQ